MNVLQVKIIHLVEINPRDGRRLRNIICIVVSPALYIHVYQVDFKVENMRESRIWNSSIRRGEPLIWSMCTGTFYRCINNPSTYTCTCLRKGTFQRSLAWVYDTLHKLDATVYYMYIYRLNNHIFLYFVF